MNPQVFRSHDLPSHTRPASALVCAGLVLLLTACGKDKGDFGTETVSPPVDTGGSTDTDKGLWSADQPIGDAFVLESCDGIDNDGDGLVDEGFSDVDGDGEADCVDEDCTIDLSGSTEVVTAQSACVGPEWDPTGDPWSSKVRWSSEIPENGCRFFVGDIDDDGISEVLCSAEELYVFDGATGELKWQSSLFDSWSPVTLADLNGDGHIDIAGIEPTGQIIAVDGTGGILWESTEDLGCTYYTGGTYWIFAPLIPFDLGSDGHVELIGHHGILNGADGSLVARLDPDDVLAYEPRDLLVADLDLDGVPEICDHFACRGSNGAVLWEVLPPDDWSESRTATPLAVQADDDPEGEVLWLSRGQWAILSDSDGTEILRYQMGQDYYFNRAAAADIDGDGISEILIGFSDNVLAMELDGTAIWSQIVADISTGTTAIVYDLDGDGDLELLYSDENEWAAYDAATGVPLMTNTEWRSATIWEMPIVIDLDGDGSAEIVNGCVSGGPDCRDTYGNPTVVVYENPDGAWAPTFPLWPYDSYSGVGINPDGSIQRTADPSWTTTGIWRGSPALPVTGFDLQVELLDACVSSCTEDSAEIHLALRVANLGPLEAPEDTSIVVYSLDEAGNRTLLQSITLADIAAASAPWYSGSPFLDNGLASPAYEFVTTLGLAKQGLVFVAGDDGSGNLPFDECAAADNTLKWTPAELCP